MMDDQFQRDEIDTAPHNLDAEQAVLGALFYWNDVLDEFDWLRSDHFYDPVHSRIYQAAVDLIRRGSLADAVTIKSELIGDHGLQAIGGDSYLALLVESACDNRSAPEYAKIIVEASSRRSMIQTGLRLQKEAIGGDRSADDLLDTVEAEVAAIRDLRGEKAQFDDGAAGARLIAEELSAALDSPKGGSGVSTGFETLDARTGGFQRGDLIIIAGRPSMGKTALGRNIAFNAAKKGSKVLFLSLEMSKRQVWFRTVAAEGYQTDLGVTISDLTQSSFSKEDIADINHVMDYVKPRLATIRVDDTRGLSASDVRRAARQAKREMGGLDMIVIDYLGKMRHPDRRFSNKSDLIGETTGMLKNLAGEMDLPVVTLAQLSRKVEERDDKRPQMSDLRDSGEIEQDADVIMFVYREAYYLDRKRPEKDAKGYNEWMIEFNSVARIMQVITAKQRQGEIGSDRLEYFQEYDAIQDLRSEHG